MAYGISIQIFVPLQNYFPSFQKFHSLKVAFPDYIQILIGDNRKKQGSVVRDQGSVVRNQVSVDGLNADP